jgi:hypothetical protein
MITILNTKKTKSTITLFLSNYQEIIITRSTPENDEYYINKWTNFYKEYGQTIKENSQEA